MEVPESVVRHLFLEVTDLVEDHNITPTVFVEVCQGAATARDARPTHAR